MVRERFPMTATIYFIAGTILLLFSSCISYRSDIEGLYTADKSSNDQLAPVSVFFHFTHLEQTIGFDAVPKIVQARRGFRDIFGESMKQFSNIRSYATFTDNENDVDNVPRRTARDSLKSSNDFTIHLTIKQESSFTKHILGIIFTCGTLDIVPIGYSWNYIVNVDVCNSKGKVVRSYSRTSVLSTWHNVVFLFVYPFFPSEVKIEEIYFESMQNIFKQIEAETILTK